MILILSIWVFWIFCFLGLMFFIIQKLNFDDLELDFISLLIIWTLAPIFLLNLIYSMWKDSLEYPWHSNNDTSTIKFHVYKTFYIFPRFSRDKKLLFFKKGFVIEAVDGQRLFSKRVANLTQKEYLEELLKYK